MFIVQENTNEYKGIMEENYFFPIYLTKRRKVNFLLRCKRIKKGRTGKGAAA